MEPWQTALLHTARVARLATVDPAGQPHVVPIVFVYDGGRLFTPLDAKPKHVPASQLRRARNLAANDRAAVVVDHYDEDWQQLAWVQIRGRAALLADGDEYAAGLTLLRQKYPQYATLSLAGRPLIRITVAQVRGWRAAPPGEVT